MSAVKILSHLRTLGIELKADGDNLVCNAPKGALTQELQAELIAQKSEIISILQNTGAVAANEELPVHYSGQNGPPPLSFAQERLWYLDQLEPDSATYNLPSAVAIDGELDVDLLRTAINEIVKRYDILRTRFGTNDGSPVQIVEPRLEIELPIVDLSDLPPQDREKELQLFLRKTARMPFDLENGPLLRVSCLKMGRDRHVLSLMTHHSIFDGSSFGLFLAELSEIYDAFLDGNDSPLEDVKAQYASYATWQREHLAGRELGNLLEYWRDKLNGQLPVLAIPTDHPRPPVQSYRGSTETSELPIELTNSLTKIGREEGATLFMVLFAAFNVLLQRYTGQDDFIVGTPMNGRNRPEFEKAIGFFVNTLALRTDVSGEPTFRELLQRVKRSCLDAYAHQELPFERLVQELDVERDLSRTPLFQSMFAFQDTTSRRVQSDTLNMEAMRVDTGKSRTDISFWLSRTQEGLKIVVEYSDDLFEEQTILQMLSHYQQLLAGIVSNQDSVVSEIPILTSSEQQKIVKEWNSTDTTYDSAKTIHAMFEAQVLNSPDSAALVFDGNQTTYEDLNKYANRLARHLLNAGVRPKTPVGICMERSTDMMVGLLAILKADCAFVPLDPDFPSERLAYMIDDAGIEFLVTQSSVLDTLPNNNARALCIDDEQIGVAECCSENLVQTGSGDDLAYVIYTSGSTGKPKGVMVPHRGVSNFLNSMKEEPGLDHSDRLLAVTTLSFDIAVLELFLPLVVGATVVIANREVAMDGRQLLDVLQKERISVMQATPATWQLLIDNGWDATLPIKVLCGGEAMIQELASELLHRSDSVWNLYGPTETTIWSTCARVTPDDGPVLIGRPIANTQVYVLDRHKNPVPPGVCGEIYIGGDGVTSGYMNNPQRTADVFLPGDIVGDDQSIYRTGDLGRWRMDGMLEHLGRADNQVKVRGYRIELGEIESGLSEHPSVDRVAVNVWQAAPSDHRLVAYLVVAPGSDLDPIALRKHLSARLPGYMLPQHYVELDSLPLTPNGKTDRKRLPTPTGVGDCQNQNPPETEIENLVAAVWSDLLGIKQPGRHDNFFELGGHSLLAVKVVLELEEKTGARIELRQILLEDLSQVARFIQSSGGATKDAGTTSANTSGLFGKLIQWSRGG